MVSLMLDTGDDNVAHDGDLDAKLIDDTAGSNAHCFALSDYTPGKAMAPASRAHFRSLILIRQQEMAKKLVYLSKIYIIHAVRDSWFI